MLDRKVLRVPRAHKGSAASKGLGIRVRREHQCNLPDMNSRRYAPGVGWLVAMPSLASSNDSTHLIPSVFTPP